MAEDRFLYRPVRLEFFSGVEVSGPRLASMARRHDVVMGTFTDEEMVVCGDNLDSSGDPHWTPYLHRLTGAEGEVAQAACVRLLESRAVAQFDDEGNPALAQPHVTLGWAIAHATALATWRADVRGDTSVVGGAFVLPHGLVLHDEISPEPGFHELVLRSHEREAAWLAALLDPTDCAVLTDVPETAATVDELAPRVADLAQRARSSTVMAVATTAGGGQEQAVTAYGTDDGLWLFQGRRGEEPGAILQRVGDSDILAVARELIALAGGTPGSRRGWPSRRP